MSKSRVVEAKRRVLDPRADLRDKIVTEARLTAAPVQRRKRVVGGEGGEGKMERIARELHKPARRNFPRRRVVTKGPHDLWKADLVEMQEQSRENRGYRYMLTVID